MSETKSDEEEKWVDESHVHEDAEHHYRISSTFSTHDWTDEVLCIRFDTQDKMLAYGADDGHVRIFNLKTHKTQKMLGRSNKKQTFLKPITWLRWKPSIASDEYQGVLVAASSSGNLFYLHPESNSLLETIKEENDNEVYCLDYTASGEVLASAGKDHIIRIYDDTKKEVVTKLTGVYEERHGHANRVFALKFNPKDENMLLSGGWDNNVFIWDIRHEAPVGHILGPSITGESLDIYGNRVLAGSFSNENNLCIIDLKMQKIDYQIPWYDSEAYKDTKLVPPCVYAARFTMPDAGFIVAGGTQRDEWRVFKNDDINEQIRGIGSIANLKGACVSIDCSHNKNEFAFGCCDGLIKGYRITEVS